MAPVQHQGHQQSLGQHVGVEDPPEEDDHPAERGRQLVRVHPVLVRALQQQVELARGPVPAHGGDDALYSQEPDREAQWSEES